MRMPRRFAEKSPEQCGRPRRLLQRRQVTAIAHQFKARMMHRLRELLTARRWCYRIFIARQDQRRHAQLAQPGPDIVPAGQRTRLRRASWRADAVRHGFEGGTCSVIGRAHDDFCQKLDDRVWRRFESGGKIGPAGARGTGVAAH